MLQVFVAVPILIEAAISPVHSAADVTNNAASEGRHSPVRPGRNNDRATRPQMLQRERGCLFGCIRQSRCKSVSAGAVITIFVRQGCWAWFQGISVGQRVPHKVLHSPGVGIRDFARSHGSRRQCCLQPDGQHRPRRGQGWGDHGCICSYGQRRGGGKGQRGGGGSASASASASACGGVHFVALESSGECL